MKLKFINLLLASVLLIGSAQVFTSCKDNEADLYVDLKAETISLKQKLEDDEKRLDNLEAALRQEIATRTAEVKDLSEKLAALQKQIPTDYVTHQELTQAIEKLSKEIAEKYATIVSLTEAVNRIDAALLVIDGRFNTVDQALDELRRLIKKNADDLAKIDTRVGTLEVNVETINNQIIDLYQNIARIDANYDSLEARVTVIEGTLSDVQQIISSLDQRVGLLEDKVGQLGDKIEDLYTLVGNLTDKLGNLSNKVDGIEASVIVLHNFMNKWEPLLPQIQQDAAQALATANQNAVDIASLKAVIEILQGQIELGNKQCEAAVDDLQSQINTLTAQLENCVTLPELEAAVAQLQQQAADYYNASIGYTIYMCAGLRGYIEECMRDVNNNFVDINNSLSDVNANIEEIYATIAALDGKVDTSVGNLQKQIDALQKAIEEGDKAVLDKVNEQLIALKGNIMSEITEMLKNYLPVIEQQFTGLGEQIAEVENQVGELNGKVEGFDTELGNLREALTTGMKDVNDNVDDLTERVEKIEEAIAPLRNRIEEVAGRINSIIIQQTDNAVLGTLNLPIGINSNMLLAYAGENRYPIPAPFPAAGEDFNSFNGEADGLGNLTYDELAALGVDVEYYQNGLLMDTDEATGMGVLGTLYMTVNPSNASIAGKDWAIVNSKNVALPVQISPVPSDKELNFGYTRDAHNGFYEAKALIPVEESAISKVRFTINDNVKSEIKDILKAPREIITEPRVIASLGNVLYDQFNGFLPALGVSASWTESDGQTMQVTSQYGLAVATVNPLALKFLVGQSFRNIPGLPDLSSIPDRFNAWYDSFTNKIKFVLPNSFEINFNGGNFIVAPNINLDLSIDPNQAINVKDNIEVEFNIYEKGHEDDPNYLIGVGVATVPIDVDVKLEDFINNLNANINAAVNKALDDAFGKGWVDNVNAEINGKIQDMCNEVSKGVTEVLERMQDKINQTISDVLGSLQNTINGKLNSLLNKYNGIANRVEHMIGRVNNILSDPNYYLQPVLLYKNGNNISRVSSSKAYPTRLVAGAGNSAITLIPTTHTLETAVPLYKKYVAVTHVWNTATGAEDTAVRDAANGVANSYLNQVVPATYHSMALQLKKGYTYEIIYQGLDYSANVSGAKYYITVK